ncbi:HIT family protein [Candidatus Uabimicrobium sp. HlEnr_7]|uniref:HIT family protein n=1 Tax=Candidatus Uabimicrobium helgolandensis TaxID=3095367 RepID=UPI003558863A
MATIFDKIIAGEIPCAKVYEDDHFLAFLDVRPVNTGHTLVIPKQPQSYIFDLDNNTYTNLMALTKKIACHLKEKLDCKRVCMTVIGWEVPHVHVHLIPTNEIKELPLNGPNVKQATIEELSKVAEKLQGL